MVGSRRFIEKVWRLRDKVQSSKSKGKSEGQKDESEAQITVEDRLLHKTIKKVSADIGTMAFNTAVSTLMIAVNELEKVESITRPQFEMVLQLLAPFAPHVTEELWRSLGNTNSIHISDWPIYDARLVVEDEVTIVVQVNGKVRASFKTSADMSESDIETAARELPEIKKWTEGKEVKKVIVIKGKLVSIVVV